MLNQKTYKGDLLFWDMLIKNNLQYHGINEYPKFNDFWNLKLFNQTLN